MKDKQRIELETEFKSRLDEAIQKSSADQAAKEQALVQTAEAEKMKALLEIQKQNEADLKAKLEAAEQEKRK